MIGIFERSWFSKQMKAAFLEVRPHLEIVIIDKSLEIDPDVTSKINILITNRFQFATLPELVRKLPNLEWIHSNAAGCNELFSPKRVFPKTPSWTLTRTGGYLGVLVAEYVIGHIIAHERSFFHFHQCQKEGVWFDRSMGAEILEFRPLGRLTVAILGAGSLGQEVSRACGAMRMTTIGVGRTKSDPIKQQKFDKYFTVDELSEALSEADYIVGVLPCTEQTRNLLGNGTFKACKKKPVFINCGRGSVIKENDLIEAVNAGWLSAAVLDCFETEPLPSESALWSTKNVHITPHVSACNIPEESTNLFLQNLDLFNQKKPLKFVIDWEAGY